MCDLALSQSGKSHHQQDSMETKTEISKICQISQATQKIRFLTLNASLQQEYLK